MSGYGSGATGGAWAVLTRRSVETCPKCGYDLRGLIDGVRCPECGTDTAMASTDGPFVSLGRESPLGAAPRGYLAVLMLGFLLSAAGWTGMSLPAFLAVLGVRAFSPKAFGLIGFLSVAVWGVGQWLITRPRPLGTRTAAAWNRKAEWSGLRLTLRVSFLLAALGVLSAMWMMTGGPSIATLAWGVLIGFSAAASCWYMARVAEWAPDDALTWRLRSAAWAIGAGALVLGIVFGPTWSGKYAIGWLVGGFALMYGLGSLALLVFQLQGAHMVLWAIRNENERLARDERMRARAERERRDAEVQRFIESRSIPPANEHLIAEVEARHRAMEAQAAAGNVPPPSAPLGRVVERAGEAETYGLEGHGDSDGLRG